MKAKDHKSEIIRINGYDHIPYRSEFLEAEEMITKSENFYNWLDKRRSVRNFSNKWVCKEVIENIILAAGTAPSGAHKQPWTFCAVSHKEVKKKIREAAEKEERDNYDHRMSEQWKKDLLPFGTDDNKEFLEIAPWLIVVFKKVYDVQPNNEKLNNYYVNESVGIACGLLIAAIHQAGLVTLTHTPSPLNFLTEVLDRPKNERPFLLLPVGYPHEAAYVPDIKRKELENISSFYE